MISRGKTDGVMMWRWTEDGVADALSADAQKKQRRLGITNGALKIST